MPTIEELNTGKWVWYFDHWKLAEEIWPTVNPTYPWHIHLRWWIEGLFEKITSIKKHRM